MSARDESALLDQAFAATGNVLGAAAATEAVEVRCDEAGGADRYRAERTVDVEVGAAEVADLTQQLADAWRDLGYSVEELSGSDVADVAVFAERGAVRVSAVVGDLGAGRAVIGLGGSTGCHRR